MELDVSEVDILLVIIGYLPLTIAFFLVISKILPLFTSYPDLSIPSSVIALLVLIGYGMVRFRGDKF